MSRVYLLLNLQVPLSRASLSIIYGLKRVTRNLVITFSDNKIVAWVVLVAEFVQQTFLPTTKINLN